MEGERPAEQTSGAALPASLLAAGLIQGTVGLGALAIATWILVLGARDSLRGVAVLAIVSLAAMAAGVQLLRQRLGVWWWLSLALTLTLLLAAIYNLLTEYGHLHGGEVGDELGIVLAMLQVALLWRGRTHYTAA
jgi:hypothetical protein